MNTQFSLGTKIKVGIIGFGRMGRFYWDAMRKSGRWDIAYICDTNPASRELAKELSPESYVIEDNQKIFEDESVQVVGLFTLADSRMEQIEKAIRYGKHIIAEKPVADTMENEWKVVEMAESSDVFSTVNLYLRNSWYHNLMKEYIRQGEIGELAIIRICHMTPGLAPGEGHEYEGPAFHDCGTDHRKESAGFLPGGDFPAAWNVRQLAWHSRFRSAGAVGADIRNGPAGMYFRFRRIPHLPGWRSNRKCGNVLLRGRSRETAPLLSASRRRRWRLPHFQRRGVPGDRSGPCKKNGRLPPVRMDRL